MPEYRAIRGSVFLYGFLAVWGVTGFAVSGLLVIDGVPWEVRAAYVVAMAALLVCACWSLTRVALSLTLAADQLRWRASLRSGSIPVADLVSIYPILFSRLTAFRHSGGRPLLVMADKGLLPFMDELSKACPSVRVESTWFFRLMERSLGRSGFRPGR